ncbi:MAG: hypothetical protein DMG03_24525 [Acidobacteria bacterium]|nr:MAG: hypothetical protein DMG03_24525 [Acidobacteriota bacterium]
MRVLWTAVGLIGAIVALTLLVRAIEPSFAFFPLAGETTTPSQFGVRYEAIAIHTRDGEQLRAWWLHADAPRAGIVYFHGNGGNLSVWAPIVASIAERGYSVLAIDYRGYGSSSGRPSERGLYVTTTYTYRSCTGDDRSEPRWRRTRRPSHDPTD